MLALICALTACGEDPVAEEAPGLVPVSTERLDPLVGALVREAEAKVRAAPRDAAAHGRLGMLLDAHGLLEEAAVHYARAAELAPEAARWPALEATCWPDDPERSLRLLEEAHARDPDRPAVTLKLARERLRRGEGEEARRLYREALASPPHVAHAAYGLARIAMEEGDLDEAAEHVDTALGKLPDFREARALKARLLARRGREEEARDIVAGLGEDTGTTPFEDEDRAAVLAMETSIPAVRSELRRLLGAGREDAAARLLHRIAGLGPAARAPFAAESALLALRRGRTREAAGHLEAALARDPEDRLALDLAWHTLPGLGRGERLLELLRAARPEEGSDRELLRREARLLASLGREGKAVALLRSTGRSEGLEAADHALLAWLLATAADPSLRDGAAAARHLEELPPPRADEQARRLDLEAVVLAAQGRFDAARRRTEEAIAIAGAARDEAFLETLRRRLARFAGGRPWIESAP